MATTMPAQQTSAVRTLTIAATGLGGLVSLGSGALMLQSSNGLRQAIGIGTIAAGVLALGATVVLATALDVPTAKNA